MKGRNETNEDESSVLPERKKRMKGRNETNEDENLVLPERKRDEREK